MSAATVIELDASELRLVEYVAQERSAAAMRLGREPILGERDLAADMLGAAGEYAVSRFTGYVWNALRDRPGDVADVDGVIEVKSIADRKHSLLIPLAKLCRDRLYVLALVALPRVEILGAVDGSTVEASDVDRNLPYAAYRIAQRDPRILRGAALERFRAPRAPIVDDHNDGAF
jgi:hypothetical protein